MYIHLGGWGGGGGSMHLWTQRVIAVQTLECKQKYGEIMNFDERIERALGEIPLPACSHSWPILTLKDSEKSFLQSHLWQLDMCFFPSLIFDTDKIIKMDYLELNARGQNKMSNPLMKTKHMGCVWCKRQRERERERKRDVWKLNERKKEKSPEDLKALRKRLKLWERADGFLAHTLVFVWSLSLPACTNNTGKTKQFQKCHNWICLQSMVGVDGWEGEKCVCGGG